MKNISIILFICLLFSCIQPMDEIIIEQPIEPETIEEPEIIEEIPATPRTPEMPIVPIIPEEENMILAYLNYDGKLFEYTDESELIELKTGISECIKAGDNFYTDLDIDPGPLNGGLYSDTVVCQGTDKDIYKIVDSEPEKIFDNTRGRDAIFPAGGDGIVLEFRFIKPNGVIENASFIGANGGIIYKCEEVGAVWKKYIRVSGSWELVGSGVNTLWIEHGQVNCDGVIIHSMGSTLKDGNLSEPIFDPLTKKYNSGNAFRQYLNPGEDRRIMTGLGFVDGIAYFLCARDGKIYKYNVENDTIDIWIEITTGTGNDDKVDSYALFKATAPVLSNGFIFYWTNETIWKIDISDGVKTEVAEATSLKAWAAE